MTHNSLKCQLIIPFVIITLSASCSAMDADIAAGLKMSSKTMRSLARVYLAYGKYDQARTMAERALDQAEDASAEAGERGMCLIDLGTVYSSLDMLVEAEAMLSEGIVYQKQALGESHPYVAHSLRMLCDVCRRQNKLDSAQQALTDAVTIMLDCHTPQSREMAPFYYESAKLLWAQDNMAAAQETFENALTLMEEQFGARHLMTATVLIDFAEFRIADHQLEAAEVMIDRALEIQDRYYDPDHPRHVQAWLVKARLCRAQGDFKKSETWISRAIETTSRSRNVVSLASLHDRVNRLRTEDQVAAALR